MLEITERATVLRDGKVAGTIEIRQASKDDLVRLIIGRALAPVARSDAPANAADSVIAVEALSDLFIERLSLSIGRGESSASRGSFVQDMFYGGALVLAVTLSQIVRGREEQQF